MQGCRSAEYLTSLSSVKTSPKWTFRGKPGSFRTVETPGPGAYGSLSPSKARFVGNPSYGFGTSPREGNRPQTAPGPGQYSPADPRAVSSKYGFGTSGRQKQGRPSNPGPGAYTHNAPMGSEGPKYSAAPRREGKRVPDVPGPGAYQSTEATISALQQPKYGFGTSPREVRSAPCTPGPGAYAAGDALSGPKYTISTRKDNARALDSPGPGAYCGAHTTFGY